MKNDQDEFFAYTFLDPKNPPKQVMLQFNDELGSIVPIGESLIPYGQENTESKVKMGPLPDLGKWVRLSVTARNRS